MKQIYILTTILLLTCIHINAQTTDVVTGLDSPFGLVLNGNDLYITEFGANKISKIDISAATPTATDVVIGLDNPIGLALNGNDLYFTEFGKISKIDITATTPAATDVITANILTGLSNFPTGLALNGNDLYITQPDSNSNRISKIDITATTPIATYVVGGLDGPTALLLNGNDLYITETAGNKISKIDITATTPTATDVVTGLSNPNSLAINGNYLYISENNKISKIDITETTPTATDVVTGLDSPFGLALNGNDLYIAQSNSKVIKTSITALSINNNILTSKIQLYPNPANDYIRLNNLSEAENYIIYNVNGSEISKGTIVNDEKINIKTLSNGIYFLKFERGNTLKFIKKYNRL